MKIAPTLLSGKWLPGLEGNLPGEKDEIWTDQTMCETEKQAELHSLAMLGAYEAGQKYEKRRMRDFLENNAVQAPLSKTKI